MSAGEDKTVTSPLAVRAAVAPERDAAALAIGPGITIRQYEVIRELGRGGMGQVFLARDTRLARRVALKFLTTGSRGLTERFLVEARATARCTHENIVVIHEVDEHAGTPYMVLEYLEGAPLRSIMTGERVSASRAVELLVPVVSALVRAEEFGIVHRDLKPENIFLTGAGMIKVLDFGIAKLLDSREERRSAPPPGELAVTGTGAGTLLGTVPYMSPEHVGVDLVDHRADLWAIGIMLFELVSGRHPLAPATVPKLIAELANLDDPMPEIGADVPDVPDRLRAAIRRCLAKRKAERFSSAAELRSELESLLPGRHGRRLADDESPYPGLTSFQESDADRFFGRGHDIARMATRLREQPLVGIVGPSGVGKSSLVRAGVAPALKASGEPWHVQIVRPGRAPVASLAAMLTGDRADDGLTSRLAREPGALGALLRARAARDQVKQLIFVDQFEELYTLCLDEAQRRAFTACLSGVADDASGPLRIAVAMRSDFLDRVGEDPQFLDALTPGLVFLQPLGREGLREALTRPLEALGYAFESPEIVDHVVDALATTPGALPLLQFAASRLWDVRDRQRKLLTQAGLRAIGGLAGALASHADQVLGALPPAAQRYARTVFLRLVTPERTRAVVDRGELRGLARDAASIDTTVDHLVAARLLVVQSQGEADTAIDNTIELVHESLIGGWPTLRRWLDEDQEDASYLAHLRTAARQWQLKDRAAGLLWRGEAEREARHFRARYRGELAEREREFLDAVLQLGSRSMRFRRAAVIGGMVLLASIAAGSAIALVAIRNEAERTEVEKARAQDQADRAQQEAERARNAEARVRAQLEEIRTEQAARAKAEREARTRGTEAEMSKEQLQIALARTEKEKALAEQESRRAREAETRAEQAAAAEKQTRKEAEALYHEEKQRTRELEERGKQITTQLPK